MEKHELDEVDTEELRYVEVVKTFDYGGVPLFRVNLVRSSRKTKQVEAFRIWTKNNRSWSFEDGALITAKKIREMVLNTERIEWRDVENRSNNRVVQGAVEIELPQFG